MPDSALLLEGAAKALLYASLLLSIGACAAYWFLLPRTGLLPRTSEAPAARLGLLAACLALFATVLRGWTHTVAVFGFEGARSWDTLMLVAFGSRWGQSWRVQIVAAGICVIAFAATGRSRRFWPFATLATAVFAATIPLLGHAAGSGLRTAVHVAHIVAAGVWLGSLTVVVLITRDRLPILRRFSVVALPAAATVATAGLIASWLYVGDLSNLWRTDYGRILLLKMGLVGCIGACGFSNWRRLRKRGEACVSSVILTEVFLAVSVAIVSGYLTETAHP